MTLNTASEVISLSRKLEEESKSFYQALAQRHPELSEHFLSFAKENEKYTREVERVYYGVITDALEGGFTFRIEPGDYRISTKLQEEISLARAIGTAIKMEEKLQKFYMYSAKQSKSLMADIPRAFAQIVRKRQNRIEELRAMVVMNLNRHEFRSSVY